MRNVKEEASMPTKAVLPGKSQVFYGWFALAGAVLVALVGSGAFIYSYGVFLPVMCSEFGWSRAVVASGLSLGFLCFGLPGPLAGISIAKFGPRVNIVLGNFLSALGLAGMSLAQEVWHVYLLYSLAGLGISFGGYIACATVANNWFIKKRSLAMAIVIASASLGGFIFPPLATVLISAIGWRISWLVLAGILCVIACLIGGLILVRDRPEDIGQAPDGTSAESTEDMGTLDHPSMTGLADWQTKQALQQPATWLITAFIAAAYFALGTMIAHQVAHVQDLGFNPVVAALTMSLVSGMIIIGRLGFGALALRFNTRYLVSASFAIQMIAVVILLTTKSLGLIYIYGVLFGLSTGAITAAMPTFIGTYYGRAHYAQILGVVLALGIVVEAAAPAIAGAIYDATASYTPHFALVAAFSLAGLICAFLARQPRLPQQEVISR